ncbi:hypothetical protein AMTRI_Chr04g247750 [Amborella trichopoda]
MRNLLKKFHRTPTQSDDSDAPLSSQSEQLQKPLSALSGWLSSVTRHSPPSSSRSSRDSTDAQASPSNTRHSPGSSSRVSKELADVQPTPSSTRGCGFVKVDSDCVSTSDPAMEEEYQIQIALALSANEDPEAAQIEAVKQISLGSCAIQSTSAEVVAYRYWNYDALGYDDKILDGFYDLYGILSVSTSDKMPSLVDLQETPISDNISWEAVLVNRAVDDDLVKLEERALVMAMESRSVSFGVIGSDLVKKLAVLVTDYMGGSVKDPECMLKAWRVQNDGLRAMVGNMVLPLGRLRIGLARHRALLFKVLADGVGIPCLLVKGRQYTGADDGAMNIVKIDHEREYIVDLMGEPGTLIPADAVGTQNEYEDTVLSVSSSFLKDVENISLAPSASASVSSCCGASKHAPKDCRSGSGSAIHEESESSNARGLNKFEDKKNMMSVSSNKGSPSMQHEREKSKLDPGGDFQKLYNIEVPPARGFSGKTNYPYVHARSPSWTEGVSSPSVQRMKVKDVSQYMIDAAKENPELAQKLHDVLLESGVVAPPNLFTEISTEQLQAQAIEDKKQAEDHFEKKKRKNGTRFIGGTDAGAPCRLLPPVPNHGVASKVCPGFDHKELIKPVEGLGLPHTSSPFEVSYLPASSLPDNSQGKFIKHVPVAAAAAVASSMVVAASKSSIESNLEVPVAAAATATAAVVVATTAAVSRQYEHMDSFQALLPNGALCNKQINCKVGTLEADGGVKEPQGIDHGKDIGGQVQRNQEACAAHHEDERTSDKCTGNESVRSDPALDDVAEWEIHWEEITLGERIGLGIEVAVKKFLDQDISGDALEEFRSEIRIMKRLRHPNVVLFMGAVTRAPNLSIVTEFLPRGSLYRLIHRPNNQLDERRRLRMALDVARGMNYLHNSTPLIVHRDLKSPNLLVDKNWVVKVCDFGLSRMKHNTFLSSRSTAGTAEWMAPEVLRNEPSDEKCDVYSFGVILWELATMQQPWGGMNPMQVVGAVGFQHRRLDIPDDMDPVLGDIIRKCWQTDPKLRPSFSEIMAALKPLQKPMTSTSVTRQGRNR